MSNAVVILITVFASLFLMICILFYKILRYVSKDLLEKNREQIELIKPSLKPLEDAINILPGKVITSIQSSVNRKKGCLGELIGYIELEAEYDRIIPLGNIIDFVCIKFPSETDSGRIDFVDIKTGNRPKLSTAQRQLQQLIVDKKINFIKLTVNTQTSDKGEDISETD